MSHAYVDHDWLTVLSVLHFPALGWFLASAFPKTKTRMRIREGRAVDAREILLVGLTDPAAERTE
ncbi:hypothetical protein ACWGNM_32920 [Streptomyces sp. NPDC055796]